MAIEIHLAFHSFAMMIYSACFIAATYGESDKILGMWEKAKGWRKPVILLLILISPFLFIAFVVVAVVASVGLFFSSSISWYKERWHIEQIEWGSAG